MTVVGDVGQPQVVAAGMTAQRGERRRHVEALALGHHALGLLDHDPAVEGVGELLGEDLRPDRGSVLEDGDGGDIREGLRGVDVGREQVPRLGVEEVERADDRAAQPHRQRVDGAEPGGERLVREARPTAVGPGQVLVHDRRPTAVAVQARPLLGLQLEQLEHPHHLAGRRHHP
jgi:hypothetical protein